MNNRAFALPFIFAFFSLSLSQTTISGNIGGKTFTPSGNPWIVTENIVVEKEKTVQIKAGCVFLFKQFTAIEVHGGLVVEGTEKSPVVFTSSGGPKAAKTPIEKGAFTNVAPRLDPLL